MKDFVDQVDFRCCHDNRDLLRDCKFVKFHMLIVINVVVAFVVVVVIIVVVDVISSVKICFDPLFRFVQINDTPDLKKWLATILIVHWSRVVKPIDPIPMKYDLMKRLMTNRDFLVTHKLPVALLKWFFCMTTAWFVSFVIFHHSATVDFSFFEDLV